MGRLRRAVLAGVPHHVTQRGNNRQAVFFTDEDFRWYLHLLTERAAPCGVRVLAYCLMTNHVHLVVVPEQEDSLARLLQRTHSGYAVTINQRLERSGHVWQNQFYSCPMDTTHLIRAMRYVELNPVRAGMAAAAWQWPWSSARAHVSAWESDEVLAADWREFVGPWNYREWGELLAGEDAEAELEAVREATRRGAPLGSAGFVEEWERRSGRRLRVLGRGRPRKAEAEEKGV